jgi:uncharacterized protein (TIGR03437 family)
MSVFQCQPIRLISLALAATTVVHAANQFTCVANVAVTPTMRAEGFTEATGDIILTCSGGTPTPAGMPIPLGTVSVTLNTPITSTIMGPNGASDALLLIDEPNTASNPAPFVVVLAGQTVNFVGGPNPLAQGNTFQGTQTSENTVTWVGVPILSPETTGASRIYRITNIRANALALGAGATVGANVAGNLGSLPGLTVGVVQKSLSFGVPLTATVSNATPQNLNLAPGSQPVNPFALNFGQEIPNAFKIQYGPPTDQATPASFIFDTTEGWLTAPGGFGQAASGTKLSATFTVPGPGSTVYVSNTNVTSSSAGGLITLDGVAHSALGTPGSPAYTALPTVNGVATGVWTVQQPILPSALQAFGITGYVSFTAAATPGTILVAGGYDQIGPTQEPNIPSGLTGFFLPGNLPPSTSSSIYLNPNLQKVGVVTITGPSALPGISLSTPSSGLNFSGNAQPANVVVTGLDSMGNPLTGITALSASPATWLKISTPPTPASAPATVTVSVDPTGLAPGPYSADITFVADGQTASLPVTLTVPPAGSPIITPAGVTSAGDYVGGVISPGEIIDIFGTNIGPSTPQGLQIGSNGTVSNDIAGVQVWFDGKAAPLIYASKGQVAAVVPFAVTGITWMQIMVNGEPSPTLLMPVAQAIPALLTSDSSGFGQAAALNQDGSINNASNPAKAGNVIVLFGTGFGPTTPVVPDGSIYSAPLPKLSLPITATIGGQPATVQYAGPAPGLVAGVMQVNVVIPPGAGTGAVPVQLWVGGAYATQANVTVSLK